MIFQYEYKFNLSNILSLGKFKKLNILDFGCGIGNWKTSDIKSKNIRKITLYDKNKELINCLKSKYKSKKVNINFDNKKINIPNRWYTHDNNSYPLENHKYFKFYKKHINKIIYDKNIDVVYTVGDVNFKKFKIYFKNLCFDTFKINELTTINVFINCK